jgi:hypothetical protein
MNDAAIQNLEFLRQLIAEARGEAPFMDMLRLRMIQSGDQGMRATTTTGAE